MGMNPIKGHVCLQSAQLGWISPAMSTALENQQAGKAHFVLKSVLTQTYLGPLPCLPNANVSNLWLQ